MNKKEALELFTKNAEEYRHFCTGLSCEECPFFTPDADKTCYFQGLSTNEVYMWLTQGQLINIKSCGDWPFSTIPQYKTPGSVGADCVACLTCEVLIWPNTIRIIPLGFAIELPSGYEAQIRPRSGLASKYGITLINSPATIDTDYRGEVHASLINLGTSAYTIRPGDRICQMIIQRVGPQRQFQLVGKLTETLRNDGGFGSTGR